MQHLHYLVKSYQKDLEIPAIPDFSNDENVRNMLSKIAFQQKFWQDYSKMFEIFCRTEKLWHQLHSAENQPFFVLHKQNREFYARYRALPFEQIFAEKTRDQFLMKILPSQDFSLLTLMREAFVLHHQFGKIQKLTEFEVIFPPYEAHPQYRKNLKKLVRTYRARYTEFVRKLNEKSDLSFDLC